LPPLELMEAPARESIDAGEVELERLGHVLIETLRTFRVEGTIVGRTTGPVVSQYEVAPAPGVKVGRIAALADDLALAMRAQSIRIVAPIPGKAAVGVEVPNPTARMVRLRELIDNEAWDRARASLPIALGRDLEGSPVIADLARMPHLLIAGATGSGKSVCINTIITSLIYRYTPRDLRMLMIDPKMVELTGYNALPHLRHAVVTNNKNAAQALKWAVVEMERRYGLFNANGARNIGDFNRKVTDGKELVLPWSGERGAGSGKARAEGGEGPAPRSPSPAPYTEGTLPFIVVIVDELADLMMTVQGDVEKPLAMLAQKARATGIHLILATQRPSVNVITGLIKANFPSRIAFRVASKVDSRTILDQNGAEALLGNGDMLFLPPGKSEPVRVQGAFIGTEESEAITDWYAEQKRLRDEALEAQGLIPPDEAEMDILEQIAAIEIEAQDGGDGAGAGGVAERDVLFIEAAEICLQHQQGSTSLLQRKLRIGYGRAARIIDQLHDAGILGPPDGSKPRDVLIGPSQLEEYSQ
jgi:S-DNA-T family DNA segregation ATPase FtsK/SpoIIIE